MAQEKGNIVEAKDFEITTINFSDVARVTSISRVSSPFEPVAMLNNMHTLCGINGDHHIYKEEIFCDISFMVCRLPIRNGDLCAGASCVTTSEFICAVGSEVQHKPDTQSRLISEVHSETVAAGKNLISILFKQKVGLSNKT